MNNQHVANVYFREVHFKPFYNMFLTMPCNGVQLHYDPKTAGNLVEINFRILRELGAPAILKVTAANASHPSTKSAAATRPATCWKIRETSTRCSRSGRRTTKRFGRAEEVVAV